MQKIDFRICEKFVASVSADTNCYFINSGICNIQKRSKDTMVTYVAELFCEIFKRFRDNKKDLHV